MADSWISETEVVARLKAEADLDFKRLGHKNMTTWILGKNNTFTCYCQTCKAQCSISPRCVGKMRLRGEAVVFRCRSEK